MITPAYAPTATERVLPRLALDFTTASLDSRVTVTRALNTATVTNSSGLVQVVNADLPRFDYDPVTLACKGLLIEESRVNRLPYSADFNSWTKADVTVSTDAATAPDGTSSADKIIAAVANTPHLVSQTGLSSSVSVLSFYAKAAEETVVSGWLGGAAVGAVFNLATGVASSQGATSFGMYPVGNGWYRCWVYWTTATTTAHIYMRTGGAFAGNGTDGLFLWGAQLEAGAFATSYIPTTTTSVTRNADVVSMTGANFSSWYNASQGAFVAWFDTVSPAGVGYIYSANAGGSIGDSIFQTAYADTTDNYVLSGGVQQARLLSGVITANTRAKTGLRYANASFATAANGGSLQSQLSGSLPVGIDRLHIGYSAGGGNFLNGHIAELLWYTSLTNAELVAFTK